MHYVLIDDKAHIVEKNKKYLVGKIYNFISEDFPDYDEKIVRRTIKKFLDLIITD
jgi:spore coat polysaccharide biosynthesis predicted glycosyltransferase SpsG